MLLVQGSRASALPGDSQGPPCSLVSVDVTCEWNQVTSPRTAWARPLAAELCEPAPPGPLLAGGHGAPLSLPRG